MKTKMFLWVCLIAAMAVTHAAAQNGNNDDNTNTEKYFATCTHYYLPVYCNNEVVDVLTGSQDVYGLLHYRNGVLIWGNYHSDGIVTSVLTGEVFTLQENDVKQMTGDGPTLTWHTNLRGDQGSHYIARVTATWTEGAGDIVDADWLWVVHKFICLENGK
jgi:hypothetical protein